ncbi:MAG: DNA topoisomerase I, partial [Calditrichia bacterium]|nr:DNA topoisomerase I [Calditrichia bacterium]
DSTRVSNEALHFVRELIEKKYGKENLPAKPNFFGKKKKAQDAHEAVRPTYISEDFAPENIKKYLSRDQLRLYTLIWNRFVASQMKPAKFEITTILTGNKKYVFETKGEKNTFKGFLTIYKIDKEENGDGGTNGNDKIPHKIEKKDPVELQQLNTSQEFTRPPARYTESSIVKKLDQLGIGRPSTYAQIITTLFDRLYIEKEEKKLIPTELGKIVSRLLVKIFPDLFNVKFTAMMEDELDKIEQATEQYINVMKKFYNPFSKI